MTWARIWVRVRVRATARAMDIDRLQDSAMSAVRIMVKVRVIF
jgi:hypothetical protein